MSTLLTLAVVLLVLWIVVTVFFELAGLLVNLLLLIGAVMFVAWLWKKLTGRDSTEPTDTTL
ncbi:MAG: hypothetical protein ACYC28_09820 [Longimicrobiales bacterium]